MTKRTKEILHSLLYLALLVSGVFTAWQIHIWWVGRSPQAGGEVDVETYRANPSQPPEVDISGLLKGSGAGDFAGLAPLKDDPADLTPPDGAVRRLAFRRSMGSEALLLARYDYRGSIGAAGSYYLELLRKRGYRLLSDSQAQDASMGPGLPRRSLNFDQGRRKVNLLLENSPARDDLVSIVLVVSEPASPAQRPVATRPVTSRPRPTRLAPLTMPAPIVPYEPETTEDGNEE